MVDDFIEYPLGLRSLSGFLDLRKKILDTGSDTLIYLNASRGRWKVFRDIIFFKLCGLKNIIGAPTSRDLLNCRRDSQTNEIESETSRLVRTLERLGSIDLQSRGNWDLRMNSNEIEESLRAMTPVGSNPYFVINMGGKDPSKDWGLEAWITLIKELAKEYAYFALIIVGAEDDKDRAETVLALWPTKKINFCGVLMPRITACVLKNAVFFLGHDSGAAQYWA